MSKKIYELKISFNTERAAQEDILIEVLMSLGIELQDIISATTNDGGSLSVYFSNLQDVKKASSKLKRFDISGLRIVVVGLQKQDWYRDDIEDFKPFALTDQFVVVPGGKASSYKGKKEAIMIDHGYAFGSGKHPTTRFMAEFIQSKSHRVKSLIDIGTGTGILAIVALKCGIENVSALDVCEDSVKSAYQNVECNGLKIKEIKVLDLREWRKKDQYDFVAANLITEELIPLAEKLIQMTAFGGYLAVSGVPLARYSLFREKYQQYPLKCLKVSKGGGWTAILFKRK